MLLRKKVDNLISTVDVNAQQIDGSTDEVLAMGSIQAKFEAFGWHVISVAQGNELDAVKSASYRSNGSYRSWQTGVYSSTYRDGQRC